MAGETTDPKPQAIRFEEGTRDLQPTGIKKVGEDSRLLQFEDGSVAADVRLDGKRQTVGAKSLKDALTYVAQDAWTDPELRPLVAAGVCEVIMCASGVSAMGEINVAYAGTEHGQGDPGDTPQSRRHAQIQENLMGWAQDMQAGQTPPVEVLGEVARIARDCGDDAFTEQLGRFIPVMRSIDIDAADNVLKF